MLLNVGPDAYGNIPPESLQILSELGASIRMVSRSTYEIDTSHLDSTEVSNELSRQMRASYYFLGALLGRFGSGQVAMPGGCNFGGVRPIYDDSVTSMYTATNASSKEEALLNAQNFNIQLAEEGFVLLKNENSALPLSDGARISVFGKNSVNLSYGGSGSGGFDTSNSRDLYDSLEAAGFETNPTLREFYEDDSASGSPRAANSSDLDSGDNQIISVGETPQDMYTDEVTASYADYSDAALVVITRIGGEGFDLPRYQGDTEGAYSPDSHYLELDANERDMLTAVCDAGFDHVIVMFNVPASFEATFLTDPEYAGVADKIDAAIWAGFPGSTGIMALGEIMNGSVNPSGRLPDTWAADFSKDPTFINFGTGSTPLCK